MLDAFIYDHVRTPRGRSKADGALHEVTALNLASQALGAIKKRNGLDTGQVDDVVLGVFDPVGDAAADIARTSAPVAGYGDSVAGAQINRFCASGLDAVNFAAALIGNAGAGKRAGLKPRTKIKAFADIGSNPALMLTGPVDATKKLLHRTGMTFSDIDLIEINEAFASVVLRYLQAFDLATARVNVNGGAIALRHPLGATGAMVLGAVLDELERRNLSIALVTLCIGAGMGTATLIERV